MLTHTPQLPAVRVGPGGHLWRVGGHGHRRQFPGTQEGNAAVVVFEMRWGPSGGFRGWLCVYVCLLWCGVMDG